MKIRSSLLYVLMVAQALGLSALYAYHASGRDAKMVIRLEAKPADPRDLFRGDYIILRYPGLDAVVGPAYEKKPMPATFYVTLRQAGNVWTGNEMRDDKPGNEAAFLLVRSDNDYRWEYGIETYYVPEGEGRPQGKLVMEVAVHADGQAQIRQLYCDGKAWP